MATKPADPEVQRWLHTISQYETEFKDWERRTKKVIDRYTDKKSVQRRSARFNILWSNVQTLVPACFSRIPKASVSRRFKDTDPVGRVAAMLLERALQFEVEQYADFRQALKSDVQDRFLGGRGTAWVRYEPHMQTVEGPIAGVQVSEDAEEPQAQEVLEYECAPIDYVHWRDFGHTVARTWEEVTAVWRRVYMGRKALVDRFGDEMGKKIPLDTKPEDLKKLGQLDGPQDDALAVIYEIWDKSSGEALWLSKSLGDIVDRQPDPLGLQEFWPCPRPLYGTLTSDSLVPVPDLVFYQDQADSCDTLADRISGLIDALKVRGCYDGAIPELARLFTEGDNNTLIPVKNWAAFAEKNGLQGALSLVDLKPIAEALQIAFATFQQQIDQIYQITGIADIIRGDTDANETLGAQRIKGQFATLRIRDSKQAVAYFASELLRIKAQIICSKFQPQTLMEIGAADQFSEADRALVEPAIALLKQANERTFRIEVEADSLVQLDEQLEKEERMEFLGAVGQYIEKAVQGAQIAPEMAPLMAALLKFAVGGFKVGKSVEGDIDQTIEQLKIKAANPVQKPDPETIKVQGALQLQQAKAQAEVQTKQMELQFEDAKDQRQSERDMQVEQWKQQMQAAENERSQALEAQKMALEMQQAAALKEQERQHAAQLEDMKRAHEAQLKGMDLDFQRWKVIQDNERAVVVAQIAAGAKAATAAMGAEGEAESAEPKEDANAAVLAAIQGLAEAFSRPRQYGAIRGADGKIAGFSQLH